MRLEKRILVVDDDDAIRALVRTVVRRRGFAVDAARNGLDALEQIQARRYSMIVLDLMMPLMSGYELLEHLARLPVDERPCVLVLTAGLEPRVLNTELVIGTIHKPFDLNLLLDTITACLSAGSGSAQIPGDVELSSDSQPN
jgi:DNA-binding response OmpR family regulator